MNSSEELKTKGEKERAPRDETTNQIGESPVLWRSLENVTNNFDRFAKVVAL